MKNKYYDEETSSKKPAWEDAAYEAFAEEALSEIDEDAISYADEEHRDEDDIPEEPAGAGKGKRKKSAERIAREERFLSIYEEYFHPTQKYSAYRIQCQLDDLYSLLYELNKGWAYKKAQRYKFAGFLEADGEDALAIGCAPLYNLIKMDREANNYRTYPIRYYLCIAQRRAIDDYFRHNFGRLSPRKRPADSDPNGAFAPAEELPRRRKVPYTISIDAPISDDDARYWGERLSEASVDPFANPQRPRRERDEKAYRLELIFLRELMDYPYDPPKPLALMYGSVLFQLYKDKDGTSTLSMMAKSSTKLSSPEWAHKLMGRATLLQLGIFAERKLRKHCSKSLTWGTAFRQHMSERTADGSGRVWADIVYTQTYTKENTSNWIEAIMCSTMKKCSRKLKGDPDLAEYATEIFGSKNKFRKALEKMEKEGRG